MHKLHIRFHINHNHRQIRQFLKFINDNQIIQNSCIIENFFLCHEAKGDVKINVQNDLIFDDQQKHFIFICFVCKIHDENFVIFQSQFL